MGDYPFLVECGGVETNCENYRLNGSRLNGSGIKPFFKVSNPLAAYKYFKGR
jgi:hypothetical protein